MDDSEYTNYLAPSALAVTPNNWRKILILGSCQLGGLAYLLGQKGIAHDHLLITHAAALPEHPPEPVAAYDFQLLQIAVRAIVPEGVFSNDLAKLPSAFDQAVERLEMNVEGMLRYAKQGLPAFVLNLLVPQANPMGRLQPRYHLSNPMFFFEELNRKLEDIVRRHPNAYLLDADGLAAAHGRRFVQDDALSTFSHSALISDWGFDRDQLRLHPTPSPSATLESRTTDFTLAIFAEAEAMFRTLRQVDQVKIVVVDLDDTMWRGVLAESEEFDIWDAMDGWPLGFLEALSYLKKRGVLLAIVSKNDEAKARAIWEKVYGAYFPIDEFAVIAINWQSKADNLAEILNKVNLLSTGAVFVDDNPAERAAMEAALPGIRTLGAHQYAFRRDILWAPETQVTAITDESLRRSEMVQAQLARELVRARLSPEEFLQELNVRIEHGSLNSGDDPRFARALELINKSNQFNTTGRRWTATELERYIDEGGLVAIAHVRDNFTDYGLVAILIAQTGAIEQYVMSCRVVGLGVEEAVIGQFIDRCRAEGRSQVTAKLVVTDANGPARGLWLKMGGIEASDWPGHYILVGH